MVPDIWSETGRTFCHVGSFFALLTTQPQPPPNDLMIPKIKILKNTMEKCLEILSFYIYMCTINENHSCNIRCNRQKFLSLWAIFCPLQKIKLSQQHSLVGLGDIIAEGMNVSSTLEKHHAHLL